MKMKVAIKIDVTKEVGNIMLQQTHFTEDNLLPTGKLDPLVNVDFVAGVAIGRLFALRELAYGGDAEGENYSYTKLSEMTDQIELAMEDIKTWAKLAKE